MDKRFSSKILYKKAFVWIDQFTFSIHWAKSKQDKLSSPRSSKYLLLKDVVDNLIPVGIMRGRVDRAEFTTDSIHIHTKSNGCLSLKLSPVQWGQWDDVLQNISDGCLDDYIMYNIISSPKNLSDLFAMEDHFLVKGEYMTKQTGMDPNSETVFVWVDPTTRSMHWSSQPKDSSHSEGSKFLQFLDNHGSNSTKKRPQMGENKGIVDKAKCTDEQLVVLTTSGIKHALKMKESSLSYWELMLHMIAIENMDDDVLSESSAGEEKS